MSQYTVIAMLQAKPEKVSELKEALTYVAAQSRAENACLEYRLHQDLNNPSLFILFENWKSKELHQEQFSKPYIIDLAQQLDVLLAKPFQGFSALELQP